VTDHIKIFGEYKYNDFEADLPSYNTPLAGRNVDTTLSLRESIVMFGLTYRFGFGKDPQKKKKQGSSYQRPFDRPSLPSSGELSP
jgi:hypothetical protein